MKHNKIILPALLFCYALVKLPLLFSYSDTISYELYRGTVALEFLEGLKLSLGNYLTDPYSLAVLFNGFLTAPFFFLFGKTMFALKLVPFLWHALGVVVWFYLLRPFFSSKVSFFILLLLILAPPGIAAHMMSNHGTHFEMVLWTGLSILILNRILNTDRKIFLWSLLLGFLGGFSSSLMPTNLVTVAAVLIYYTLTKRKKEFYLGYLVGFLTGFSPWLIFNATHDWQGLDWPTQVLFHSFSWDWFLHNLWTIFLKWDEGLRGLFSFKLLPSPFANFFAFGYLGIYLVSLLILTVRRKGFLENFALLYQIIMFAIIVESQYGWGKRYLFPLVPFVGLTIVCAFKEAKAFFKWPVFTFCFIAGLAGDFYLIDFSGLGKNLKLQGYSFEAFGQVMEHRFGDDLALFRNAEKKILASRSFNERRAFYLGLPSDIVASSPSKKMESLLKYVNDVEKEFQPILYEKLGIHLGSLVEFDAGKLEDWLKSHQIPNEFYPFLYRGVIGGLNQTSFGLSEKMEKGLRFCESSPAVVKFACYEGLGILGDLDFVSSKIKYHNAFLSRLEKADRPFYFLGLGRYFASIWQADPKMIEDWARSFESEDRTWFREGLKKEISLTEDPWKRGEWIKNASAF